MQTVGLYDDLHIAVVPHAEGIDLRCDVPTLAVDQTNLVHRAATLVLEHARLKLGLAIELQKRIPMGAGLGGGSSDAAAVISGLNRLLGLGWSSSTLGEIGEKLGSDVPFFFAAPTAVATGRGEQVRTVALPEPRWVVLVNPGFPVDTRWAYQQLASSRREVKPVSESTHRLADRSTVPWEVITAEAVNDFEPTVFEAYPILREIKLRLTAAGADMSLLSGSGATVFGIFRDKDLASRAHEALAADGRHAVYMVETCARPSV